MLFETSVSIRRAPCDFVPLQQEVHHILQSELEEPSRIFKNPCESNFQYFYESVKVDVELEALGCDRKSYLSS